MDLDTFFGTSKWQILEILAEKPSSPSEIASKLNTSVSYVSQQLKLLEAANIVRKEKTGSADKGKPRNLYSLSNELFHLTILSKGWSAKKLLHLTEYHKIILRIWLIDNSLLHEPIAKLYQMIHDDLSEIDSIYFHNISRPEVLVVSNSKKVKAKLDNFLKDYKGILDCSLYSIKDISGKNPSNLFLIYEKSSYSFSKEERMKGGKNL